MTVWWLDVAVTRYLCAVVHHHDGCLLQLMVGQLDAGTGGVDHQTSALGEAHIQRIKAGMVCLIIVTHLPKQVWYAMCNERFIVL